MNKISKTAQKMGFTLAELMVVIALMAVLGTLIAGAIRLASDKAKVTAHQTNAKMIIAALEDGNSKFRVFCGTNMPTCSATTALTTIGTGTQVSFTAAAKSMGLEARLTQTSECSGTTAGGGVIAADSYRYYVLTADAACTKKINGAVFGDTVIDPVNDTINF
ncbi:MAG: type II secretion system protein [bacterium]